MPEGEPRPFAVMQSRHFFHFYISADCFGASLDTKETSNGENKGRHGKERDILLCIFSDGKMCKGAGLKISILETPLFFPLIFLSGFVYFCLPNVLLSD